MQLIFGHQLNRQGRPGRIGDISVLRQVVELWHAPNAAILHALRLTITLITAMAVTQRIVEFHRVRDCSLNSFDGVHSVHHFLLFILLLRIYSRVTPDQLRSRVRELRTLMHGYPMPMGLTVK